MRQGAIPCRAVAELCQSLKSFELNLSSTIGRKLVRLLWCIPIYLEYQKDTLKPILVKKEHLDYIKLANRIREEIERLLGYP